MWTLYDLLLLLGLLVYAPVHFIKGKRRGNLNLWARLGLKLRPRDSRNPCLWFHAVSVGEVLSLRNLFQELKNEHPDWEIYCSTLTSTGYLVANEKLAGLASIFYAPLDFSRTVRRFFKAIHPDLFLLVESEFWPNLIRAAKKETRAALLVNGRVSEHSFRRYRVAKAWVGWVLNHLERFLVQTDEDRQRLLCLGVKPEKIEVVGNLKSDVRLPVFSEAQLNSLKQTIGLAGETRVIVAGSTHRGEEEILFHSLREALKIRGNLRLILAPRHIERTNDLEKLARNFGFRVVPKTEVGLEKNWDVLILNTIGELSHFYALADLAFVGGSLVPRGGQNLLEPAFYEKPLAFGPHMENFAWLAEEFLRRRAARQVRSEKELTDFLASQDNSALQEMGRRARAVLDSLQGATQKTLRVIENLMLNPHSPTEQTQQR